MGVNFDRWTFLKLIELGFTLSCLICKRVTDDEASRLFLYLQKLSREWSLLNNVTWDKIGAAVADATYGGYVIITAALFIGRVLGELPTVKRVTEIVLLLLGAFLYIVLGSLVLASLDYVPNDLIDNAAVLGTLSLITAALFLLDLAGPRAKKPKKEVIIKEVKLTESKEGAKPEVYNIEKEIEVLESRRLEHEKPRKTIAQEEHISRNGLGKNGTYNGAIKNGQNGYKKMRDKPKRFDIYGKDYGSESDGESTQEADEQSPVWSQIRKGHYGKYDFAAPTFWYPKDHNDRDDRTPSSPGDPGYVQYTAKRWGQPQMQKTPRQSPTEV